MKIKKMYDESQKVRLDCSKDVKITKDCFKDECDINNIMKRYAKTGIIPESLSNGTYGDFTQAMDYQSALNLVIDAQNQFDELPSNIREHFAYDPEKFLAAVHDKGRRDELVSIGLIKASDHVKVENMAISEANTEVKK